MKTTDQVNKLKINLKYPNILFFILFYFNHPCFIHFQADFEEDLIKQVINNVAENHLDPDTHIYSEQINELANKLVDECMKELLKLKKMFKFFVTVLIQQKNGSALNMGGKIFYI